MWMGKVAERFLGCLRRDHDLVDLDDVDGRRPKGHAELVYDFRDGGEADGWLHALFRYEDRSPATWLKSSFGAHIFNTVMTYRDEPHLLRSAAGIDDAAVPEARRCSGGRFAVPDLPGIRALARQSPRRWICTTRRGGDSERSALTIACSGSTMVWPHEVFGRHRAAPGGA